MRIAVVGQGYVGLTASVCLVDAGHCVIGVEKDERKLVLLRSGRSPIFEPGLEDLLHVGLHSGRLEFSASLRSVDGPVDAVVIAVGSPQLPSGGADLREVTAAVQEVASLAHVPDLIMVKSTVPPGTSERLLAEANGDGWLTERYAYSPEFLSQGSALAGWQHPSRVVVGVKDRRVVQLVQDLYRGIEAPWLVTTPTNAEMIKYASNAFLATKIAFVNEIANLCEDVGATIDDVVAGMGLDPRIGTAYFRAGIGYGGSCFPKDTRALSHLSSVRGKSMPLLEAVISTNNAQRLRVVAMLKEHLGEVPGRKVAILGLSFKPHTDDTREAPSLTVVPEIQALGHKVTVWDPVVPQVVAAALFPGVEHTRSLAYALREASAAVILTEWPHVIEADWFALAPAMEHPRVIIDGRNCLDPAIVKAAGLAYRGIGRR